MVFLGAPGVGKTYFCSALLSWVYKKVPTVRYWNERDLFSRIRRSIGESKGEYLASLEWLLDDHFLMIDDVGSSGFNEWRREILLHAIDLRYESMKPTVFTSNLTSKQIEEGLGLRCHSRLFSAENTIIEMHEARDLRKVIMS